MSVDLAQPRVLCAPRVIHRHRALCQRMNRVFFGVHMPILKRWIPDRQRVHRDLDLATQMLWRLPRADAFGGGLEFAHGFDVKLEDIGLYHIIEPHLHGPVLVVHREGFIISAILGNMLDPKAAVLDIVVDLALIHVTAPALQTLFACAEPSQRPNSWTANVVSDVVGVILVFLAAVLIHETRQVQHRAKLTKHRLEAADIAVRLDHGPADRIGHTVGLAYRAVQQRDTIVPFQIGCVWQNQIGISHHFG